jgi:hypothetical protein
MLAGMDQGLPRFISHFSRTRMTGAAFMKFGLAPTT